MQVISTLKQSLDRTGFVKIYFRVEKQKQQQQQQQQQQQKRIFEFNVIELQL